MKRKYNGCMITAIAIIFLAIVYLIWTFTMMS